jgi:hypothetical protein
MPLAQIVNQGSINLAALVTPGVIVVIVPPPLYGQPQPTDTGCVLGTASWGKTNIPYLMGSTGDLNYDFGGINGMVSYNDPYDLAEHANIAFMQANGQQSSLQLFGIRVSDGTDLAATIALKDTTTGTALTGGTATAICTGLYGDQIKINFTAGNLPNTINATITAKFRANRPESFLNIPCSSGADSTFWVNFANALANGTSQRGPSELISLANPSTTAMPPALGTFTLTGGTDGRSVTSSNFIGANSQNGACTGAYAMQGVVPSVNQFWCAGLVDNTVYATLQSIADTLGAGTFLNMTKGLSTSDAITLIQTLGIIDYNVSYVSGDYLFWYDPVNGQRRLQEATPFIAGRILTLSPEQSPGNKYVQGVTGSLRNSVQGGNQPYTEAELGLLTTYGILLVCNPINRGNAWGIFHGKNSSQVSNPVTGKIEYARMTNYMAKSYAAIMGAFVDELQSDDPDDELRAAVKLAADTLCQALKTNKQIDAYANTCDQNLNTTLTVAKGYLYLQSEVRYLASADFIVIELMGGVTELGALQVTAAISPSTTTQAAA